MPFSFGIDDINRGDSVSTQCSIAHGDFPIKIEWFVNDKPVTHYDNEILIAKLGKRVSALTIDSVDAKHVGNYTCVASNKAGIVNYTAQLIINGTRT